MVASAANPGLMGRNLDCDHYLLDPGSLSLLSVASSGCHRPHSTAAWRVGGGFVAAMGLRTTPLPLRAIEASNASPGEASALALWKMSDQGAAAQRVGP